MDIPSRTTVLLQHKTYQVLLMAAHSISFYKDNTLIMWSEKNVDYNQPLFLTKTVRKTSQIITTVLYAKNIQYRYLFPVK